jgi:4-hydroxy-2-oxoglutarate aldolase
VSPKNRQLLSGVFAPMVTPFDDDRILLKGLIANVEKMNGSGLRGYFVLGTNGEYKTLSPRERDRVLSAVVGRRSPEVLVMAGCGAESTHLTIELTKRAVDCGADLVSILMPHFFAKRVDAEVMASYVLEVADASPVPVVLYNNPSVAAGVTIGPEVVRKVQSHPNVIGIKDSSAQTWQENLKAASQEFSVLAGSANYFLELLQSGGTGGVLSLANVFPEQCVAVYRAFADKRLEEARSLNERLVALNHKVSGSYGVAGVKTAMDLVGLCGGAPRRPIPALPESEKRKLEAMLREMGFLR